MLLGSANAWWITLQSALFIPLDPIAVRTKKLIAQKELVRIAFEERKKIGNERYGVKSSSFFITATVYVVYL